MLIIEIETITSTRNTAIYNAHTIVRIYKPIEKDVFETVAHVFKHTYKSGRYLHGYGDGNKPTWCTNVKRNRYVANINDTEIKSIIKKILQIDFNY